MILSCSLVLVDVVFIRFAQWTRRRASRRVASPASLVLAIPLDRAAHRGQVCRVDHQRASPTGVGVAQRCRLVQRHPIGAPTIRLPAATTLHHDRSAHHPWHTWHTATTRIQNTGFARPRRLHRRRDRSGTKHPRHRRQLIPPFETERTPPENSESHTPAVRLYSGAGSIQSSGTMIFASTPVCSFKS